jgi:hypothetical protein
LNTLIKFLLAIALFAECVPSFAQDKRDSISIHIPLGEVWFNGKSAKLTKHAKAILSSFIVPIQAKPTLKVQAVAYNKDFCSECDARSWKRSISVLNYLSKHGVPDDRLVFTNKLDSGELNKVELSLVYFPPDDNTPHPVMGRRD